MVACKLGDALLLQLENDRNVTDWNRGFLSYRTSAIRSVECNLSSHTRNRNT